MAIWPAAGALLTIPSEAASTAHGVPGTPKERLTAESVSASTCVNP